MADSNSGTAPRVAPLASIGSLRAHAQLYVAMGRLMFLRTMQYRVGNAVEMTLMLAEPMVYLLVWRAVAEAQGGSVDGFTPERFAAYFIVWSMVRVCTQVGSPSNWEHFIKDGRMNTLLLRPMHPVHQDLAMWLGFAVARLLLWVPAGVVLVLAFRPELSTSIGQALVFVPALAIANVMNSLLNSVVGAWAFWIGRVGGLSMLTALLSLTLSGRIVPLELMPGWVQGMAWASPFPWTFAFPIETLIGPTSGRDLAIGVAMQLLWFGVFALAVRMVWGRGVKRYGAFGG